MEKLKDEMEKLKDVLVGNEKKKPKNQQMDYI